MSKSNGTDNKVNAKDFDLRAMHELYWMTRVRAWMETAGEKPADPAEVKLLLKCYEEGVFGSAHTLRLSDTGVADDDELTFNSPYLSKNAAGGNGVQAAG